MFKSFVHRAPSLVFVFLLPFGLVVSPGTLFALSSHTQPLASNIFVEIAKKQNPAVVNVSTKAKAETAHKNFRVPRPGPGQNKSPDPFRDFYDRFFGERPNQRPKRGMGSGFVIDKEGHILTNYHVIEGAGEIVVILDDNGTEKDYTATLVGSDPKTDIALIKINRESGDNKDFPFLRLGSSENLEVG